MNGITLCSACRSGCNAPIMEPSAWPKAFALWVLILVLAVLNGTLRESILLPALGRFGAFVASGTILSGCILLVAFAAVPWYGALPARQWVAIGLFWLCLTLAFEFGFGRFLQHRSWSELLQAYTFKDGNIWPLVLVVTAVSPWLAARWRGLA